MQLSMSAVGLNIAAWFGRGDEVNYGTGYLISECTWGFVGNVLEMLIW